MTAKLDPTSDLRLILALARAESDGKLDRYLPALQRAYARTLTYMVEHPECWAKIEKIVKLTHSTKG